MNIPDGQQLQNRENNNNGSSCSFCHVHPKQLVVGVCSFCLNERLLVIAAKQGTATCTSGGGRCYPTTFGINNNGRKQNQQLPPSNKKKIFALGSLLLTGGQCQGYSWEADNYESADDDLSTSSSLEDSFISIRFEQNGTVSWENNSKTNNNNTTTTTEQEHLSTKHPPLLAAQPQCTTYYTKVNNNNNNNNSFPAEQQHQSRIPPRGGSATLRWRKRVSQLLHLIKWRTSHNSSLPLSYTSNAVDDVNWGDGRKNTNTGSGSGGFCWITRALTRRRPKTSCKQY